MNVYERVVDGQVVERVQPTPGDYEDTRLGVAILDGLNGWRLADGAADAGPAPETPADDTPGEPAAPAPVATITKATKPDAPADTEE